MNALYDTNFHQASVTFQFDDIELISPMCGKNSKVRNEALKTLNDPRNLNLMMDSLESLVDVRIVDFVDCKLETVFVYQVPRQQVVADEVKVTLTTVELVKFRAIFFEISSFEQFLEIFEFCVLF